ncbi:unnamed protein product [Thelazia callipaeda]|uniref:PBPe domain-containing protein n=1 Tax=Thelazia callipaeda TaxID=103827 RepID=A0A0N5D788_THECL|nr:unnamed protein product [Thelazia callipaeda]
MQYILASVFCILSKVMVKAVQTSYPPFFSPCTFPSPIHQPVQFRSYCNLMLRLPFICDLHQQISSSGSTTILETFEKLKPIFVKNNSFSLGILVVRQLAPPISSSFVYNNKFEYGCLFEDHCIHMDVEKVQQFVSNAQSFIKIYTSVLYDRWFFKSEDCNQLNILAIIILDGLVNDVRKLPYVKIHASDLRLLSSVINIQSECVNNILQGWPLHVVIADLIEQLSYALRDFYLLNGDVRLHVVPTWAIQIFITCALLLLLAIFMEWYIVRRRLASRRSMTTAQLHAGKSKTHIIFY